MSNPSMPKIACILPSRGLVFSQTVEEILREFTSVECEWQIFWSHMRPIPACFNEATERALDHDRNFTHFWFVEEDMGLPEGILANMLKRDAHAITADYPVTTQPSGTILRDRETGKAYFTGCGCLLVKRQVLESFDRPIWRSNIEWTIKKKRKEMHITSRERTEEEIKTIYGFQDIDFGIRLFLMSKSIEIYDDQVCWQRKLSNLGRQNNNFYGYHSIIEARETVKTYLELDETISNPYCINES